MGRPALEDEISVDMRTGKILIMHRRPRSTLYVPGGIGFPYNLDNIRSESESFCVVDDPYPLGPVENFEVFDDWRVDGPATTHADHWTGYTVLYFTGYSGPNVEADDSSSWPSPSDDEPGGDEGGAGKEDREGKPGDPPSKRPRLQAGRGSSRLPAGAESSHKGGGSNGNPAEDFKPQELKEAEKYVQVIDALEGATPAVWATVCQQGDALLMATGSVERAASALWAVRESQGRNNLAGVDDPTLENLLHPDHLAYLRDVRHQGMPARYQGERTRVPSRLHPRAKDNLNQLYSQLMKDIGKQRVLVVSSSNPALGTTVSSPFEMVPKMLPNRSLSKEMRLVHDQRRVNQSTDKTFHPPAAQPLHEQVARRILWLKARYPNPNIKVVLAKKDVAGAFRLLWVDPKDVELFGGDIPWQPEFMCTEGKENESEAAPRGTFEQGITVLYLVSSFGFSGSPGEWATWGRATEELHRAHRPQEPRRDGALHFDGKILVDDMVLVEPCLGLRPWVSSETYEWGVVKLLGEKAINKAKGLEEGIFGPQQTVWGVCMDADKETASLPEARILKGAYLLAGSGFNYGEKTLTLKDLQRFRGIATGWAAIVTGLKNELKAADLFLGGIDGGAVIKPKLRGVGPSHEEEAQAWQDLWELFEDCRWLCARSETWAEKFGGDLREMLPPMERLALPGGMGEGPVFVSSDSTLQILGAIDWTNGKVCREYLETLKPWVQQVVEQDSEQGDRDMAIHLGEMLSFVAFACKVGPLWSGRIIVFGGDNQVVFYWIKSRRSKLRAGRLLLRVLGLVEHRFRCRVLAGWWRTFHNEDADAITRLSDEEVQLKVKEKGWELVDIKESIKKALEDTERFGACFLSWADQEDRMEMMRLHELRVFRSLYRQPQDLCNLRVKEWTMGERHVKDFEHFGGGTNGGLEVIAATIGPDPNGKAVRKFIRYLETEIYEAAVLEGPREVAWDVIKQWADKHGWKATDIEFLTTELGELLARRRVAVFIYHGPCGRKEIESFLVKTVTAPSLGSALERANPENWRSYYKFESAIGGAGETMLPMIGGHVWMDEQGERQMVYRASGPGRWPLFKGQNYPWPSNVCKRWGR